MQKINLKEKEMLLIILFFSVVIRLVNITMPLLEGTATRQIQTAMIARNFYLNSFNIFYPSVDFLGPGPGYMILEFPLLNAIIAFLYKVLGGVHEWAGRLVVIAFFIGTCLFLYKIIKRLFSGKIALISLCVFSISPLSIIYSRTVMPDFITLFFSMAALFFMLRYADAPYSRLDFWLSCAFLAFSLLTKPHSFYMLIPLVYLMWYRHKKRFILQPLNWLYFFIGILPIFLWLLHGRSMHLVTSTEEFYNFKPDNWFSLKLLWSLEYYKNTFSIINTWALSVFGFILFIAGLFIKIEKDRKRFLVAWLSGVIFYYIIFDTHIMYQPYYHVQLLPVAAVFIALSLDKIFKNSLLLKKYPVVSIFAALICAALILRYALYAYIVPKGYRHIPRLGEVIKETCPENALLVTSLPDGHSTLYYASRKGWNLEMPGNNAEKTKEAIKRLEEMKQRGAGYFVSVCESFLYDSPEFERYLLNKYKVIKSEPNLYRIFLLE